MWSVINAFRHAPLKSCVTDGYVVHACFYFCSLSTQQSASVQIKTVQIIRFGKSPGWSSVCAASGCQAHFQIARKKWTHSHNGAWCVFVCLNDKVLTLGAKYNLSLHSFHNGMLCIQCLVGPGSGQINLLTFYKDCRFCENFTHLLKVHNWETLLQEHWFPFDCVLFLLQLFQGELRHGASKINCEFFTVCFGRRSRKVIL